MKKNENIDLKNMNTFHISTVAENFYIPENENDMLLLLEKLKDEKYYILSGGSNILLNDEKIYKNVISMEKIDNSIAKIGDDIFYIGSSNRIQRVINEINKLGYGGIEELYSLPAMFGGIIYMNAGIGGRNNTLFSISQFIKRVKVISKRDKKITWVKKEDCNFEYRKSIFQDNEYIILGAECEFYKQDINKSKERITNRINSFSKKQDMGRGTFGTVFSTSSPKLLKLVSIIKFSSGGIRFGKKNSNWFVNNGGGTYKDTMRLIKLCRIMHKIFHKPIECEVQIWE